MNAPRFLLVLGCTGNLACGGNVDLAKGAAQHTQPDNAGGVGAQQPQNAQHGDASELGTTDGGVPPLAMAEDGGAGGSDFADPAPSPQDGIDPALKPYLTAAPGSLDDLGNLGGAACNGVTYPATGFYGENVLAPDRKWLGPDIALEIGAKLGVGASLRIRITHISGTPLYAGESVDWRAKSSGGFYGDQTLEARDSGRMVEGSVKIDHGGRALIEYFECDSPTPTGSKLILWGDGISDGGVL